MFRWQKSSIVFLVFNVQIIKKNRIQSRCLRHGGWKLYWVYKVLQRDHSKITFDDTVRIFFLFISLDKNPSLHHNHTFKYHKHRPHFWKIFSPTPFLCLITNLSHFYLTCGWAFWMIPKQPSSSMDLWPLSDDTSFDLPGTDFFSIKIQ